MRKIIYLLCFLLISISSIAEESDTTLVEKTILSNEQSTSAQNEAVIAYDNQDYKRAIVLLEDEIKAKKADGLESSVLYYNLGNAYFRIGELGLARLNYERAALLDPSDKDIKHNIDYVTTRIEDKIIVKDSVFISDWFHAVQNLCNSNAWTVGGILFFLLFIGCLVAFFFTQQVMIKKISFYIGIGAIVLVIFTNIFANNQKQKIMNRDSAVITASSVVIVASPDINSKELFRLHSGTKVHIRKDDRSWLEIEIADGSVGWIQGDKLEII